VVLELFGVFSHVDVDVVVYGASLVFGSVVLSMSSAVLKE
jgi:hypothetical protein